MSWPMFLLDPWPLVAPMLPGPVSGGLWITALVLVLGHCQPLE
jgi:hypothetical protein